MFVEGLPYRLCLLPVDHLRDAFIANSRAVSVPEIKIESLYESPRGRPGTAFALAVLTVNPLQSLLSSCRWEGSLPLKELESRHHFQSSN